MAPSDDIDIFSLRELYLQPIYYISIQQLAYTAFSSCSFLVVDPIV